MQQLLDVILGLEQQRLGIFCVDTPTGTSPAASLESGVVGLGRIGRHVARIGEAFGMRVAAWGRRLTDEASAGAGAERRELDVLLGEADVVTIHVSLSPPRAACSTHDASP